ncbi:MAG: hypothetical protein RL072_1733, partial [Actinomycetota bacterium]
MVSTMVSTSVPVLTTRVMVASFGSGSPGTGVMSRMSGGGESGDRGKVVVVVVR